MGDHARRCPPAGKHHLGGTGAAGGELGSEADPPGVPGDPAVDAAGRRGGGDGWHAVSGAGGACRRAVRGRLEMGGGVVRALRMARSDAAEGAGWRDLTGKLVFPGPVLLCRSGMPLAGRGGCPATTVGVPVASLAAPAPRPGYAEPDTDAAYAADAVPIPLLRGLEPELEVLPEAVFGRGCAAFAVDDRIQPGWDDDLVRVTGHCGATLVVLSDDARVMERSVGGLPLPLDGGRVVLAPADAAGMRRRTCCSPSRPLPRSAGRRCAPGRCAW